MNKQMTGMNVIRFFSLSYFKPTSFPQNASIWVTIESWRRWLAETQSDFWLPLFFSASFPWLVMLHSWCLKTENIQGLRKSSAGGQFGIRCCVPLIWHLFTNLKYSHKMHVVLRCRIQQKTFMLAELIWFWPDTNFVPLILTWLRCILQIDTWKQ